MQNLLHYYTKFLSTYLEMCSNMNLTSYIFCRLETLRIFIEDTLLFPNKERFALRSNSAFHRRGIFPLSLVMFAVMQMLERNSYSCLYFLRLLTGKIRYHNVSHILNRMRHLLFKYLSSLTQYKKL